MLKDNFDIDIQYYAMVDFKTFATAIDTLFPNGVEMNAQFSTVDGEKVSEVEVPDDLNMKDGVVPQQTIKVGKQRMDGRTLLNYSRFRKDDEGTLVGPVANKRSCPPSCTRSKIQQNSLRIRSPRESLCYDVYQCTFLLPID